MSALPAAPAIKRDSTTIAKLSCFMLPGARCRRGRTVAAALGLTDRRECYTFSSRHFNFLEAMTWRQCPTRLNLVHGAVPVSVNRQRLRF